MKFRMVEMNKKIGWIITSTLKKIGDSIIIRV